MYTQCPACLTTFKVTPAQLAARGGVVRCGICSAVFHAEQRRLQVPPPASPTVAPEPEEKPPPGTGQRRRAVKERRVTPRRRRDLIRPVPAPSVDAADFPIVTDRKTPARPRPLLRAALWSLGNLAMLLLLAGQFVFFYRDDLAGIPSWRPWVAEFCGYARCELRPLRDIAAIELLQTTIAPHPQYANALRIRTTLVNRAAFAQDYPGMEVSLTDNGGRVIARRTFTPAQYLPATAAGAMPPNVAIASLLDVTNPDTRAVGYEIRLVAP
jgi:predicted Zn finger-like uncharacterized protein